MLVCVFSLSLSLSLSLLLTFIRLIGWLQRHYRDEYLACIDKHTRNPSTHDERVLLLTTPKDAVPKQDSKLQDLLYNASDNPPPQCTAFLHNYKQSCLPSWFTHFNSKYDHERKQRILEAAREEMQKSHQQPQRK